MDRSPKLGWCGFVDTSKAIKTVIGEMAELKMAPPMKKRRAGENGLCVFRCDEGKMAG
jgi:hypothetical protein